ALYWDPSPAPVLWIHLLRFLPCAVAFLWPVVRLLPAELRDSARLDGLRPAQELRHLVWPFAARAALAAALIVAAVALGGGPASMHVETPGRWTFAHELWQQMHYGGENNVAALCLLLLAAVAASALALGLGVAVGRRARSWLARRRAEPPEPGLP